MSGLDAYMAHLPTQFIKKVVESSYDPAILQGWWVTDFRVTHRPDPEEAFAMNALACAVTWDRCRGYLQDFPSGAVAAASNKPFLSPGVMTVLILAGVTISLTTSQTTIQQLVSILRRLTHAVISLF